MSRFANGGHRHPSFYKSDLISPLKWMVCSASSAERCNHLTFSTKAWYAAFLLSKNSIIGRNFSSVPAVLQQKPGMQFFFFRKTSSSAWQPSRPAGVCSIDTASSRLLVQTLDSSDIALGEVSQLTLSKNAYKPEPYQRVTRPVGVEKLVFCTNGLKSGDRKCLHGPRRSLVGLPSPMSFPRVLRG